MFQICRATSIKNEGFLQLLSQFLIESGQGLPDTSTLELMDSVPGPRFIVSWLIWCFVVMFICVFFQLGGIVGGVAQVFQAGGMSFGDKPLAVLMAALAVGTSPCAVTIIVSALGWLVRDRARISCPSCSLSITKSVTIRSN